MMLQKQEPNQIQETTGPLNEVDGLRAQLANAHKQATLSDRRAAEAEKQIETLTNKFQALEEEHKKLLTNDVAALKADYEERVKQIETASLKSIFSTAFVAAGGEPKRAADMFKFYGARLRFIDGEPAFVDEKGAREWAFDNGKVREAGVNDMIEDLKKDEVFSAFFTTGKRGQGVDPNVRYISTAQSMDAAWLRKQGLANDYLQLRAEGKIQVSDELAQANPNIPPRAYGSRTVPRSVMTNPSAQRRIASEMGVDFLEAVQQGKIEFEAS